MTKNYSKGIYFALITAIVSGVSIFVNKFAVSAYGDPLAFTAFKNVAVGVLLICLLIFTGKLSEIKKINVKDKKLLVLIGLIGGSLPFYLFFEGISRTSAINAAIIHKSLVVWVAVLALPFLKEKLSAGQMLGVFILFASNFIVGGFKGFNFSTGELMIFAATLLWSIETIIAKKVLAKVDASVVATSRMALGALVLVAAGIVRSPGEFLQVPEMNIGQWGLVIATVIFLMAYVISWYSALKHAPAVLVTAVLVLATIITNVLSAVFVTHSWNLALSLQFLAILLGTSLFFLPSLKPARA